MVIDMETTTKTRTNAYAGRCATCNTEVPANAGSLAKENGRWTVRHLDGACPEVAPTATPTTPAPAANYGQDNEIGVYVLPDGTLVKVQPNRAKTRVYAMRWMDSGDRLVDATEEHARGDWVYESGLINRVEGARRMTLEEAKRFILRYGKCVRCSRKLKAAQSVERGIGPTCITYFTSFGEVRPTADAQRVTQPTDDFVPGSRAGGLWFDATEGDAEIEAWTAILNAARR